jgi:hypothetical protein
MSGATSEGSIPPTIARVLSRFQAMGREEKMQALVHYSKKQAIGGFPASRSSTTSA